MRRKMLAVLLIITVSLSIFLTGCHGAREHASFRLPEELDTTREITITFWAKNDTNVTQANIYKAAIAEFEALYPNITVEMRLYTDYSRIYNDVITNIATSTTPNICITYPDHIATYLTGENVVVPLDDLLTDENYGLGGSKVLFESPTVSEIVPEFLEECNFSGHQYALPYMRSTEACYVNKDYVEKLGFDLPDVLTWDFVWEVSEAAMEKDGDTFTVNGQKVMIPFIYKSTDNMMIQMLHQLGADYSDSTGHIGLFNDTTREILKEIARHAETRAFSTFQISSYPANFLNAGQCIFAVDSTAGSTWMGSHAPLLDISEDALVEFETVVYPIPQYDPENPSMISQGPSMCLFNKDDPQEVLASWLFMQYLLTDSVQIRYSSTEGYVPVTTSAQESEEYKQYLSLEGADENGHYEVKLEAVKLLLNNTENTFTTPVFNGSASLRSAAGELIENVTKSVRRKKTVDDAFIDNLYEETASLYRLDQIELSGETGYDLGALPTESAVLLAALAVCWAGIIAYLSVDAAKKRRRKKQI
jgi:multiple sugar transport system substrate-binding protein